MILVGPPDAGAKFLTGGRNPVFTVAVLLKIKSSVPGRTTSLYRMPRIIYLKLLLRTGGDLTGEVHEDCMIFPCEGQLFPVKQDFLYPQIVKKIELQAVERLGRREAKQI